MYLQLTPPAWPVLNYGRATAGFIRATCESKWPRIAIYAYPDIVNVFGKPQCLDEHQDTLLNPKVIVEVLSPSTEAYDRGRKFEHYRQIESLDQYLLLSQESMRAELYSRQAGGQWMLDFATHPDEFVELSSVGCRLRLAECYEKVDLSA